MTTQAPAAKLGMWLFLVTELTLFGGLFMAYSYLRHAHPFGFHQAGAHMNVPLGLLNTLFLLTSSLAAALAVEAHKAGRTPGARRWLAVTVAMGLAFLLVKGLEWSAKIHQGLVPGAPALAALPPGEQVFFGLYFSLTGLHGLHVLAGLLVLGTLLARPQLRLITLECGTLFWHLVDVVWIILLPLFYLAV